MGLFLRLPNGWNGRIPKGSRAIRRGVGNAIVKRLYMGKTEPYCKGCDAIFDKFLGAWLHRRDCAEVYSDEERRQFDEVFGDK